MGFRLVPKSVTLNDLGREMALILRYFTEIGRFRSRQRQRGWRQTYTVCDKSAAQLQLIMSPYFCFEKKTDDVFSERELKFTFAICHRPSVCLSVCRLSSIVCRLSVTLVRPTQVIEIFGNISTPCGTLAICNLCIKILRRSSQGNPFVGGVKHNRGSRIQRFWTYRTLYLGNGARQELSQY